MNLMIQSWGLYRMQDNNLIERAKNTEDCLEWLDVCQAECCRSINVYIKAKMTSVNAMVQLKQDISEDMLEYYKWHKVKILGKRLMLFPRKYLKKIKKSKLKYEYTCPCEMLLKNNHCSVHGTDRKPKLCRQLTAETARYMMKNLTPNCLFKYKLEAEEHEINKREENGKEVRETSQETAND